MAIGRHTYVKHIGMVNWWTNTYGRTAWTAAVRADSIDDRRRSTHADEPEGEFDGRLYVMMRMRQETVARRAHKPFPPAAGARSTFTPRTELPTRATRITHRCVGTKWWYPGG